MENHKEEVEDGNRQSRQPGFIEVNGLGDFDHPGRKERCKEGREPEHESGEGHDKGAPYQRPVLSLFSVVIEPEFWSILRQSKMKFNVLPDLDNVLLHGKELLELEPSAPGHEQEDDMVE